MTRQAREKIWVVRPGDGAAVADVLRRAGETNDALTEGRVFVGKKRVSRPEHPIRVGETVRIGARRMDGARKEAFSPSILFETDGLVACVKPAGLPTVPDRAGASHALVSIVATALGVKTEALRVTSRLDRDVSGVVIFALNDEAETRLREARAEGRYQRRYIALASTRMSPPSSPRADGAPDEERTPGAATPDEDHGLFSEVGLWDRPIGRARHPLLRAVDGPDAKEARTRWRKVATVQATSTNHGLRSAAEGGARSRSIRSIAMLAVDPETGRTHQIRVHASDAGAPLVGDRDYGGPTQLLLPNGRVLAPTRIALHAARVVVPGVHRLLEAQADVPVELAELWTSLGGDENAWARALSAETTNA